IRRDAPIEFELPKSAWREGAHAKEALDALAELEFRALVPRVKKLLDGGDQSSGEKPLQKVLGSPVLPEDGQSGQTVSQGLLASAVPADAFARAQVAVSVLDSGIAEPTLEDIARMGKSDDFSEALANLEKEIHAKELSFVYEEIELPLMPVLRGMEKRGIKVDKAF